MSKKLILVIYVVAVLILSSLAAKASTSRSLTIDSASIDQQQGILNVSGHMPTPCDIKPTIIVKQVDEKSGIVFLEAISLSPYDLCTEKIGPSFQLAMDLTNLNLTPGKAYSVMINNKDSLPYFSRREDITPPANFEESTVSGLMAESNSKDGTLELHKNNSALKVYNTNMNLNGFVNQNVWIKGYVVEMPNLDSMNAVESSSMAVVPVLVSAIIK